MALMPAFAVLASDDPGGSSMGGGRIAPGVQGRSP